LATVESAIKLRDGFSPVIRNMISAQQNIIRAFRDTETASGNAFNASAIRDARAQLAQVEVGFDQIEREIRDAEAAKQAFNREVGSGQRAVGGLLGKVRGLVAAYASIRGIRALGGLADDLTRTTAKLNVINDGLQTTADLQNMIMQSAQRSRVAYQDQANTVAKLGMHIGSAFDSNAQMISFTEQLNKTFGIMGKTGYEIDSIMHNLVMGLSEGALRGQNFNQVFARAPLIMENVAAYLGVAKYELKELASQGRLTADVMINSMFAAANDTSTAFAEIPMTFAQVMTYASNALLQAFQPTIQFIGRGAQWIFENWSQIAPVIWGVVAALAAWKLATVLKTTALFTKKMSIMAVTTAIWAKTAALMANPLTCIVVVIGLVVMAIVRWVQAVGGIRIAWMIAMHGLRTAWEWFQVKFFMGVYGVMNFLDRMGLKFTTVGTMIQNVMGDMRAGTLMILQNLINGAIDIINRFINTLNKIPGVSISLIDQVTFGTNAQLRNEAERQARNNSLYAHRAEVDANIAQRAAQLEQRRLDNAASQAYRRAEIEEARRENERNALEGYSPTVNGSPFYDPYSGIEQGVTDTAGNTARMADALDRSEEHLKYLRSIAERRAINNVTVDITVDQSNMRNTVGSDGNLDGFVRELADRVEEAVEAGVEGVYA